MVEETSESDEISAEELKQLREMSRMTKTEMANALGMTLRGYQKIESGESPLKPLYVKAAFWVLTERLLERGMIVGNNRFQDALLTAGAIMSRVVPERQRRGRPEAVLIELYRFEPGDLRIAPVAFPAHDISEVERVAKQRLLTLFAETKRSSEKPIHARLIGEDDRIMASFQLRPAARGHEVIEVDRREAERSMR
ncbi:helix-turn-helix domain-containing protein [Rhizobium leguminosarum]|uniref:helix-turn-helix domain-containing protein n=1 Tax=Rhizobium leguminosarum TaxID=384 RepID=UPI001C925A63|nr:helix-turn-helix transcriptional regulator [Rhizobium leguminosarum]MBY3043698.1 helix-turn-helix transcriptional regulator [Rhizobium leguminosarum]